MSCPKSYRARQTEAQKIRRGKRRRANAASFKQPSEKRMAEIRAFAANERANCRATAVLNRKDEPPRIVTRDRKTGFILDVQPERRFRTGPMSRGSQAIQSERQKLMKKGLLIK